MMTIYFIVAAFLYWPFKKWNATSEAPAISALLWPAIPVVFLVIIAFALLSKK